ncbi:ribonuclease H-like domain-containing protein [Tanacetum coccineum]
MLMRLMIQIGKMQWLSKYSAFNKNNTWTLVPRPAEANVVRCMWFFRHKYLANGTLSRYKARLVANGSTQLFGVDVDETFSPIGTDTAHLLPYVDDIVLTVSSEILLQRIIASLHQEFSMTDLGPLNYFLRIYVMRDSAGMFLSLRKYAIEIFERAHMHDPRVPHYRLLRGFCDMCGTLDHGLQLFSSSTTSLVTYSNADLAGYPATRRPTSEAAYRGVANVVAETCWLRNLLRELHTHLSPATLVNYDNVNAVNLSMNLILFSVNVKHGGKDDKFYETFKGANINVQVQSAANTLPENVENTPEVPKEVEPSPPTLEPVKEEPTKEPMVDAPAPAEQPPTTEVPVETETRVEEPVEETMVDASALAEEAPATEAPVDTETKVVEEAKEETMVDAPAPTERNYQEESFTHKEEMTPMALSDSEFNLANYKRGLASVEERLVFYKKNEVAPPPTGLFAPPTIDLSSSGLEEFQQPEFEGYGLRANKISDNEDEVESPVMVEKKTVVPTIPKVDIVRPKQQEKPVRKTISSGKSSTVTKLLSSVNISSGKIYTNSGNEQDRFGEIFNTFQNI